MHTCSDVLITKFEKIVRADAILFFLLRFYHHFQDIVWLLLILHRNKIYEIQNVYLKNL